MRVGGLREHVLARLERGSVERVDAAEATGISEHQLAPVLGGLLESGQICEEGGVLSLPAVSEPAPRPRRSPEHARIRGAERVEWANSLPALTRVRDELLGGELLSEKELERWVEAQGKRDPGSLEGLWELSERLNRDLGWPLNRAARFVLTGVAPPGHGIRTSVKRVVSGHGSAPPRVVIEADLDEDPEAVAAALRELQREQSVSRVAKARDAERNLVLRRFVQENGRGEAARVRWNEEHPQWRYVSRQSFHRAGRRVFPGFLGDFGRWVEKDPGG